MGIDSNFDITNKRLDSTGLSGSATPAEVSTTPTTISFKSVELTVAEKEEMALYGLDSNNPDDVAKFRAMTPEDKRSLLDEKHTHNFNIDTNSPEWTSLTPEQKIDRIVLAGIKSQPGFDEAQWNSLSVTEQNRQKNKFIEREYSEHVEGWEQKSKSERLNYISNITNLYTMSEAKDVGMSFKELLQLQKDNLEEFSRIENSFFSADSGHTKVNYLDSVIQHFKKQETEYNTTLTSRFGTENYTIDQQLEYLEQNEHRTGFENHKLRTLNELKERVGNNSSLIPNGKKSVLDVSILTEEQIEGLPRKKDDFDYEPAYANAIRMATDKIVACKTDEEFNELVKDLKPEDFLKILDEINTRKDLSPEFLNIYKNYTQNSNAGEAVLVTASANGSAEHTSERVQAIYSQALSHLKEEIASAGGDTSCVNDLATNAGQFYTRENVVLAHETVAQDGDTELVACLNEGTSEREDRHEVFAYVNDFYANSENISDDMRQFYAQNSIEVLKSPEDRQIQADSLGRYSLDSFNTGVQKGYENVANGTTSGSANSSAQNNVTNPITNNSQDISQNILNAQTILANYGEGNAIPHAEAVRMFQRMEPAEQKEFLSGLSPQQVSQIPITVCNAFPELINTFVDLGKGIDIIQQCNVNTGNRTIQVMAKSKGATKKQFNEWAANHLDRLAKCTYDDLVHSGALRVDRNRAFSSKA